uniref:Uncharacterized protein n=1 Tax=Lactuca sativa TaxID=4236 RepID=A0A9R1WF26_LACSA|nr:hypothetical protein LSAT_V11C100029820 [Lactuca sativa]
MSNEFANHKTLGDDGGGTTNNPKKRSGYRRKPKRVVLPRIKTKKKDKENRASISRSSGNSCLCITRIAKLDSCTESPSSDPNCSDFSFDSLRGLIEKSDFFLNECNTHLDVNVSDN